MTKTQPDAVATVVTVHVVFKTHLDIGFTDYAANIKRQYLESYIPAALALARQMRAREGTERFVWSTGSWLIYEYLEQATAQQRKEMDQAIADGDIAWHGLPCTFASELLDPSLFRYALSLNQKLDARYGKRTIAAKMTDVPGHTRGIVPLLAEAGIRFLHIGVNSASTAPGVPDVFLWKHPGGSELIVAYDKGGYGSTVTVPGLPSVLSIIHTNDNMGPPKPDDISQAYRKLRAEYPNAQISAGRLDDFAKDLLAVKDQLSVVTQEIGDTWIHGAATDPHKVAQYRQLCRLRDAWLRSGKVNPDDAGVERFNRLLLMIPEHTWGMDEKTFLDDDSHYTVSDLRALRQTEKCKHFEASWAEQRAYISQAILALGNEELEAQANASLATLQPSQLTRATMRQETIPSSVFETAHFRVGFDDRGAINELIDRRSGRQWATARYPLGFFHYQTFSPADYERFGQQYVRNWPNAVDWAVKDFTKPGLPEAEARHAEYWPEAAYLYRQSTPVSERFVAELHMPATCAQRYGCPALLLLEVDCPNDRAALVLTLRWFRKQANRMPEAIWFSFAPKIQNERGWTMDKLGSHTSPLDVVPGGNCHLHAVHTGVRYADEEGSLDIASLDAPLVAPGEPSLLDFNNAQPGLTKGMHFNLYNNLWGTNFPMWYDENARFRFVLSFNESLASTHTR